MSKHLHVVVPCSNTASIDAAVDHMIAYFESNASAYKPVPLVTFVRQEGSAPPNVAVLKNAGFMFGLRRSDYTCFNEIGFLPVWADYSWSDMPVALAWHDLAAGVRDHAPVSPTLRSMRENLGVLLTPNEVHLRVDGYSNLYKNEPSSAHDLRSRYHEAGIALQQRPGTFLVPGIAAQALASSGHSLATKVGVDPDQPRDGLSTLECQIVDRRAIASHTISGQVITIKYGSEFNVRADAPSPNDEGPAPDRLTRLLQKWLVSAASKNR